MEVAQPKVKYFLGCKLTRTNLILLVVGLVFVLLALIAKSNPKYDIRWNISESIKATFFIVDKAALPTRGYPMKIPLINGICFGKEEPGL